MTEDAFEPSAFRPSWWLPGPHCQTLGARFLRRVGEVPLHRERLELPDGDFVDLDFAFWRPDRVVDDRQPVVLVLHGLEGSARSKYALQLYRRLWCVGLRPIGFNFRGCSGEPNRLARSYHSGETGDLALVLRHVRSLVGPVPTGAVGFSLGGNVLLRSLVMAPSPNLRCAAVVSVPFDLARGAHHLSRTSAGIYRRYLLRKLQRKVERKRALMPASVDVPRGLKAKTFHEFDDAVTAPLHGFASADDYYERSSSGRHLGSLAVPTLIIHSRDDPFLPEAAIPTEAVANNPFIVDVMLPAGGHVGFVAGNIPGKPVFWAEDEVARFMHHELVKAPTRFR